MGPIRARIARNDSPRRSTLFLSWVVSYRQVNSFQGKKRQKTLTPYLDSNILYRYSKREVQHDSKRRTGPSYRGDLSAFSLAVADFNSDGYPDIVTANQDSDSTVVFLNDRKGGFGDPQGEFIGYEGFGPVNAPASRLISTDVDGDGIPDLALLEWSQPPSNFYQLAILLNDGNGHFSAPIRSDAIDSTLSGFFGDFTLADFRSAGHPDFLAIGIDGGLGGSPYISFAANSGAGHFGPLTVTKPANAQGKIGVGDFNGDGKLDFVAIGADNIFDPNNYESIQVFLGNGDGTFRKGSLQTFGGFNARFPAGVYVGDFNNDGKLDVIVFFEDNGGWTLDDDVFELLGNGDGTFQPAQLLFTHFAPMTVVDVSHDLRPDLLQSSFAIDVNETPIPAQFGVYLGQPSGMFSLTSTYAPYLDPSLIPQFNYTDSRYAPMVADFNGDGNLDIAAFQKGNSVISPGAFVEFLLGNGDGTFTPTFTSFDFQKFYFPNLGVDVNGDGRADLVELDGFRSSFHVLPSIPGPSFQFA